MKKISNLNEDCPNGGWLVKNNKLCIVCPDCKQPGFLSNKHDVHFTDNTIDVTGSINCTCGLKYYIKVGEVVRC